VVGGDRTTTVTGPAIVLKTHDIRRLEIAPAFAVPPCGGTSAHQIGMIQIDLTRQSPSQLTFGSDPTQDGLDRGEAWIFGLAHDGKQLEPAFVIRTVNELANGASDEIGRGHRRRSGTSLNPGGDDRVHRREHRSGDIRIVEIGNKIAEHEFTLLLKLVGSRRDGNVAEASASAAHRQLLFDLAA
jgi:hypothetical protein